MHNFLDDINYLGSLLLNGKVILCPTDTIWGLSCNAFDKNAVDRIYKIKKRDRAKPFILLAKDIDQVKRYTKNLHPRIETLLSYYNKPLTVIHQAVDTFPRHLINEKNQVAIRICKHPLIQKVITNIDQLLVSTSANLQGQPTPLVLEEIPSLVKNKVDYICHDHKQENNRIASTIINYNSEGELFFVR